MIPAWYVSLYLAMEKTAWQHGYCLALHGSLARDLDLVAVPWTEDAEGPADLVEDLVKKHGLHRGNPGDAVKPHGRLCYSLMMGQYYIDLSVTPKV